VDPSGNQSEPVCPPGQEWYCQLMSILGQPFAPPTDPLTYPGYPGDPYLPIPEYPTVPGVEPYPIDPFMYPGYPGVEPPPFEIPPEVVPLTLGQLCLRVLPFAIAIFGLCGDTPCAPHPSPPPQPQPVPQPQPIPPDEPTPRVPRDNEDWDIVYRNPREDQHPEALIVGFYPKDPDNMTRGIDFHVARGSAYSTRFISATRSLEKARKWQNASLPIYVINLDEVVGVVYDFTIPSVRDEYLHSYTARRNAISSYEVVIEGWIPPYAIKGLIDFMGEIEWLP
jgi:hypothetical protein